MLKLTSANGTYPIWVNPDSINYMLERDGGSIIFLRNDDDSLLVRETPEVVADQFRRCMWHELRRMRPRI